MPQEFPLGDRVVQQPFIVSVASFIRQQARDRSNTAGCILGSWVAMVDGAVGFERTLVVETGSLGDRFGL